MCVTFTFFIIEEFVAKEGVRRKIFEIIYRGFYCRGNLLKNDLVHSLTIIITHTFVWLVIIYRLPSVGSYNSRSSNPGSYSSGSYSSGSSNPGSYSSGS
jgi:hypothetical protein